jgi:predicted nucleotidyltransferase
MCSLIGYDRRSGDYTDMLGTTAAEPLCGVSSEATIVAMKATYRADSAGTLLFPVQYRRKALALMLLSPGRAFHVREVARLSATQPGTMVKELDRLCAAGLLEKRRVGNQVRFSANTFHPVYAELSSLLRKTVGLADVLADALEPLAGRIDAAFVFGSMASGGEHADSDVDLLVIGEASYSEVSDALVAAQTTLNREVNAKVFAATEWRERVESGAPFVKDVLAKPKIFVIGSEGALDVTG